MTRRTFVRRGLACGLVAGGIGIALTAQGETLTDALSQTVPTGR